MEEEDLGLRTPPLPGRANKTRLISPSRKRGGKSLLTTRKRRVATAGLAAGPPRAGCVVRSVPVQIETPSVARDVVASIGLSRDASRDALSVRDRQGSSS